MFMTVLAVCGKGYRGYYVKAEDGVKVGTEDMKV